MKEIIVLAEILIGLGISINLSAQNNTLLKKLPLLNQSELKTIESNLPVSILRETATRMPGQFNAVIFSGNNNINKKNTARYMAQKINATIYSVDLSLAVTNNRLATEKNLLMIFEETKNKNCVLFFDEAEALFGRRTGVSNSNDRYADEETNYFMTQVEQYRSSIIISVTASNNVNPEIFEKFVRFSIN